MKKYRCKKNIAIRYAVFGVIVLIAMSYLLINKKFFYSKATYNIAFLTVGILLGIFYVLRGKTLQLQLKEDEIFFWDGLADVRHIKLDDIEKIEYNPAIRIRFYMRDRKKTEFSIPNVFEEEEIKEFFASVQRKRKRIEVNYITRPERIIDTSKKIVRSKKITKGDNKK